MLEVRENVDLKDYNTFGVSVLGRYFVESDEVKALADFVRGQTWDPELVLVLGGGSNFLFTGDFPGVVFYPVMKGIEVVEEDQACVYVRVGSGELWDDFVCWAVEQGYGGVENLSLIPGHVGATPVQNIGAYGMEVGNVIERVEAIHLQSGRVELVRAAACRFGYRDSVFKNEWKNQFLVTHVTFRLAKEPVFNVSYGSLREEVERLGELSLNHVREAVIRIRNQKLPDVRLLPNAGSFFKNPLMRREQVERLRKQYPTLPVYPLDEDYVKVAAGWLIEAAGWKGRALGRAAVHDKQALVLVNRGGATGEEIARLANEVKNAVFMAFGVWLEPEVNII